jgi:hypothetical protein
MQKVAHGSTATIICFNHNTEKNTYLTLYLSDQEWTLSLFDNKNIEKIRNYSDYRGHPT